MKSKSSILVVTNKIVLHHLFMCLKYLRANIYNNLVQYMYPDMFAVKTISHSLNLNYVYLHCILSKIMSGVPFTILIMFSLRDFCANT